MRLKDKVAIITGSTEGIGRATALLFAREGAKVTVAGRREKEGNDAVREVREGGGSALFVKTDVTQEKDSVHLVERTIQEFGKLDILINNAAAHWLGTVLTATPEDYDRLFGVNVKGYGLCAKAAIPHLRKSGKGCIVNVASVNGVIGMPGQSLYNATKAAIISLSKSMAIDFPELRINSVLPGFTDTPTISDTFKAFGFSPEEGYRLLGNGVLLKRLAQPIEIARAILFMASDEASYVTGSTLLVDGGIAGVGNPAGGIVDDPRLDEPLQRKRPRT
jgi:NAD(P)-dependent dehydrogenase (short-subunit alcohol dehydrogenase family)